MAGRRPTGTLRERNNRFEVIFSSRALSVREVFTTRQQAECWRQAAAAAVAGGTAVPAADAYRRPSGPDQAPAFTSEQRVRTEFALAFRLWHTREFDERHTGGPERARAVESYLRLHIQPFLTANGISALQDINAKTAEKLGPFLAGREGLGRDTAPITACSSRALPASDSLLSARAAAELCGVSKATINRARIAGTLSAQAVGSQWRYTCEGLSEAGLLTASAQRHGLSAETARDVIRTVRAVLGYAAGHRCENVDPCWDIAQHWKAVQPYDKDRKRQRHSKEQANYSVTQLRSLAAALPVVHQLVLWLLAVLALRLGEAFGPRVGDWIDEGAGGLLVLREQGGRAFLRRDPATGLVTTADRAELKTLQSARILVVPEALAKVIRLVIEIFHTDPLTGLVDLEVRLVPPLNRGTGSQASFTSAFNTACKQLRLDGRTPHGLRKRQITKLHDATDLGDWVLRRFAGHLAGSDVHDRHYLVDDPEMRKLRLVAAEVDQQLDDELDGDLMVPTALRHKINKDSPLALRWPTIEASLQLAGWQIQVGGGEGLDSKQVAARLGISVTEARRRMRSAEIPARQVLRSGKRVWISEPDDVEAIYDKESSKLRLRGVAAELGISYHQAYEGLKALGRHHVAEGELLITPDDVAALRDRTDASRALRERSLPKAEALAQLQWAPASFHAALASGLLVEDPDQHGWVLRRSLEQAAGRRRGAR